ncbi:hypothetical protein FRB90_007725, partial [Tulasnella sp. 427]
LGTTPAPSTSPAAQAEVDDVVIAHSSNKAGKERHHCHLSARDDETTTTSKTSTTASTSSSATGATQNRWGQCGDIGWTGATVYALPYTCTYQNDWYSQCL